MLFHGGLTKILAVNTCMRHLKPLQFIGLIFADTAWLSKSSACAHKHRSFWRHGNAYRADTPHTPRKRGGKNSTPPSHFSLPPFLFFSGCLSSPASPTSQYLVPFRDYLVFLHFHGGKPRQARICVESCHSKPFSRVFTNNL